MKIQTHQKFSLPKRLKVGESNRSAPVWSLTPRKGRFHFKKLSYNNSTAQENDPIVAPLSSVCDRHNRPESVCCRELKGEDERELCVGLLLSFQAEIQFRMFRIDSAIVRDLIIGLADGLTVPFALTAGLASLGNSKLVVMGGLAELFSGAISMVRVAHTSPSDVTCSPYRS